MRKFLLSLLVCLSVGLFFEVTSVFAHTLQIDKNIGVNLHIDPDDAPVSGKESKFLVDIQDSSGRFNPNNPANCDCVLTVFQYGKELKKMPVVAGGAYAQLRYTFPTSGVYKIIIEGKPKGEGIPFQEFRAEFEYFVKPGSSDTSSFQVQQNGLGMYIHYIVLGIGIIIILMFVW